MNMDSRAMAKKRCQVCERIMRHWLGEQGVYPVYIVGSIHSTVIYYPLDGQSL
jgi:hypothetical protein